MTPIGIRINEACRAHGISRAELSRRVGMTPQHVQQICNGQVRDSKHFPALAKALDLSVQWLVTGAGEARPWAQPTPADGPTISLDHPRQVPLVATAGAASEGQRGVPLDPPDLLTLRPDLALVRIYGDSAAPVALHGQLAVVVAREPSADDLAMVETPDGLVLKRWCPQPDRATVVLASPNGGRGSLTYPLATIGRRWLVVGILFPEALSAAPVGRYNIRLNEASP